MNAEIIAQLKLVIIRDCGYSHKFYTICKYNLPVKFSVKGVHNMKAKILSALLFVAVLCSSACAASLPSVTMLSTKTCPACQQMAKVLKDIDAKYGVKISTAHIYLEDNPDIAKKYNVRYVPMLIFRDANGKERAREVGYRSLEQVLAIFENAGVKI